MNPSVDENAPQFSTAEYTPKEGGEVCQFCRVPLFSEYYRVNGQMSCRNCAEFSKSKAPQDGAGKFARAIVFGFGGAIAGLILYSAVAIITGWMIGFVSLAVGFIVAKAMMKGSGGLGGRKYQIVAVLLTYAAVSLSAIPIAVAQWREAAQQSAQVEQQQPGVAAEQAPSQTAPQAANEAQAAQSTGEVAADTETEAADADAAAPKSLAAVIGYLAMVGLASPFLDLVDLKHGILGLIILFVGLQIAWKTAAGSPGVEVEGPFQNVTI